MTALVSAYTPGADRNNYSGYLGFRFVAAATPVYVTSLGIDMATSDTGVETVYLLHTAATIVRTAAVTLTGGTPGTFYYAPITPLLLVPGDLYYIVSLGLIGTNFHDKGGHTLNAGAASISNAVFGDATSPIQTYTISDSNAQYFGLDLLWQATAPVVGANGLWFHH